MNAFPLLFPLFFLPLGQNLTPALGPLSPSEAEKAMVVAPGLAMQLVASEPQVVDPVCAAFDDQGLVEVGNGASHVATRVPVLISAPAPKGFEWGATH